MPNPLPQSVRRPVAPRAISDVPRFNFELIDRHLRKAGWHSRGHPRYRVAEGDPRAKAEVGKYGEIQLWFRAGEVLMTLTQDGVSNVYRAQLTPVINGLGVPLTTK